MQTMHHLVVHSMIRHPICRYTHLAVTHIQTVRKKIHHSATKRVKCVVLKSVGVKVLRTALTQYGWPCHVGARESILLRPVVLLSNRSSLHVFARVG